MATMTTSDGMFLLTHAINAAGEKNIQLNTENTFVDQNILVKITTPAADNFSLNIEDKTTNVTVGTLNTTTNKYPVTATVAGTLTAGTAGWFSSGSNYEDNVQVGLIPRAGFTVVGGVFSCNSPGYITSGDLSTITTVTPTASIDTGTSNNYNGLTTYFNTGTSSSYDVTIKPQYSTSAGYVSAATNSITTNGITYWKIITATPAFDGGAVSGTATASSTTATLSEDTNTSGISITTGGTATRTAVLYNGAVEGWVSKADNATALAAPSSAANLSQKTYYVNAVTLASGNTFNVTSAGTLNVSMSGGTTTVTSTSTSAGTVTIKAKVTNSDSSTTNQNVVSNGKWVSNTVGNSSNSTYTTKYGRTVVKYGTVSTDFANSNLLTYFTDDGTSSDYSISITPRYTVSKAGYLATATNTAGTVAYYKIRPTSITQGTTTVSGTTATRGTATWGDGWISNGSIEAATFGNAPATGKTTDSYLDISSTTAAPVLISGNYLYINQGYVDNLKISLAKLIPDTLDGNNISFAPANYIRTGYAAFDASGNQITGTMPDVTLPTSGFPSSAPSGYTSKQTLGVSGTNRYIKIDSGYVDNKYYYFIRAVTTSNIDAGNIKHNVIVKVGDSATAGSIKDVTGTFTKANTVSSGQTALSYDSTTHISGQMLENYSAWVDGLEIKGSIVTKTSTNLSFDGSTRTFTAPAGYYATNATKQIAACSITKGDGAVSLTSDNGDLSIYGTNTHGITINDNAPASDSGKVYIKVTANGTVTTGVGWNNTSTPTTSNNKIRYISLNKYDGSYTAS